MEYIVVLVTSYFRCLASAPKLRWLAGAGAPALEHEPDCRSSALLSRPRAGGAAPAEPLTSARAPPLLFVPPSVPQVRFLPLPVVLLTLIANQVGCFGIETGRRKPAAAKSHIRAIVPAAAKQMQMQMQMPPPPPRFPPPPPLPAPTHTSQQVRVVSLGVLQLSAHPTPNPMWNVLDTTLHV
jgi:hypothetical protein